jgi:hypothetical protein
MRLSLVSLLAMILVGRPAPGWTKPIPGAGTFNLVPAQCDDPQPTPPGPCAPDFTFTRGVVTLLGQKQPKPSCPKTGKPEESPAGSIKMSGVTSAGAPFSGSLVANVTFTATFGVDPNTNCDLRGVRLTVPSLSAAITCANGNCKGTFLPIACLPKQCADARVVTELEKIEVLNGTTVVARPGTILVPQATDVP